MTPVYFHNEQKENETNSQDPWLFSSGPHLLIAYTQQLEILVTSLPWVAIFYMFRIDCLELILFLFYLHIPKKFITLKKFITFVNCIFLYVTEQTLLFTGLPRKV